ncbi:WXG100-like domain-containing protein [Mycobacterium sp. NPDC003449]
MTQEVDTEQFYLVGKNLFQMAGEMFEAFDINVKMLGETGSMAGTDDAGAAWAASYDTRAREVLDAVNDLTKAMENYGGVIIQAGYNHAVAEHNATPGKQGPAPVKPAEPASTAGVLSAPPAAGGPGKGMFDYALGLVEQIGVPVPDGDTDKIDKAAQAWDRLATVYQTTNVLTGLTVQTQMFSDTKSPEIEYIAKDLTELRDAASAVLDGCAELSQSCTDYKSALDDLRGQLEDMVENLAIELAATAAITVAASFLSVGLTVGVGAAKALEAIKRYGGLIRAAINSWKISKNISKGVKRAHDIAGVRKRLERIKNLGRKGRKEEPKPPAPKRNLSDLFAAGRTPKASELDDYALSQGWTKTQTPGGPPKYLDDNGVVRMTIKEGSPRAPGSGQPHIEFRDGSGQRIDPFGNPVTRKSVDNHTPIEWDW